MMDWVAPRRHLCARVGLRGFTDPNGNLQPAWLEGPVTEVRYEPLAKAA